MAAAEQANGSVKLYYDSGATEDYLLRSVRYELDEHGVALCTYNEPGTLNSLTPNLIQETFIILEHARRDDAVKALVWTGAGRAFSSGAAMPGADTTVHMPEAAHAEYFNRKMAFRQGRGERPFWITLCLAFWDFPKISIAAVNGLTVGGAVNIAVCNYHDLVICSEAAKFKYPFVQLGATPELGSSKILPYIIGYAKAKELLFVGDWFSPKDALQLGLINKVVSAEELLPEALKTARRLAAEPNQIALKLGKQVLNGHLRAGLEEVLLEEQRVLQASFSHVRKSGGPSKFFAAPKKQPSKL